MRLRRPVVALQAQSQAGRELSTLAPLRALRARTSEPAWARRVVDEGVGLVREPGNLHVRLDGPAEFSFKVVYCRLNCDRREKSSFSTQFARCGRALRRLRTAAIPHAVARRNMRLGFDPNHECGGTPLLPTVSVANCIALHVRLKREATNYGVLRRRVRLGRSIPGRSVR
jgi:hypothetical protein